MTIVLIMIDFRLCKTISDHLLVPPFTHFMKKDILKKLYEHSINLIVFCLCNTKIMEDFYFIIFNIALKLNVLWKICLVNTYFKQIPCTEPVIQCNVLDLYIYLYTLYLSSVSIWSITLSVIYFGFIFK